MFRSECCLEGRASHASLDHAALLQGQIGFEAITDEVKEYRAERCAIADECAVAATGVCALKAAGMLEPYPPGTEF
jgi:hypothetical protein